MINCKKMKNFVKLQEKRGQLLQWILSDFEKVGNDVSDDNCTMIIRDIRLQGEAIFISCFAKPATGIFKDIQFQPTLIVSLHYTLHRPRIFNDKKIFHPNINIFTKQIIFPELIKDWKILGDFTMILKQLKYVLIEPNYNFIPNSPINVTSAWNYRYNKKNYPKLLQQNSSSSLQSQYKHQNTMQLQNLAHIDALNELQHEGKRDKMGQVSSNNEQDMELLSKRINGIDFNNDQTCQFIQSK